MPSGTRTSALDADAPAADEGLSLAEVLVEIGELSDAETEVTRLLDQRPELSEARSLLAKIKLMKGELTEAFACWAADHAQRPGTAEMRLASMLQLAEDPERGTGEFLAVGRHQLWRKPAQVLELERVFALFVRRQPDEARAASALLARKYRGGDHELYKLAVLAQAWIAELSGDLEDARRVLEDLGREKGFESDLDRALALARLYERLGGRENLERAVHVCAFLARTLTSFERVTTLGRLAALHRALGDPGSAALCERDFLAAFRRRMHRVSLADVASVAARHYLPLAKLGAIPFSEREAAAPETPRERAILLALAGERRRAAELLRRESGPLPLKYRADLLLMEGRRGDAARLYLRAWRLAPSDLRVLGWLLEQAEEGSDEAIVTTFAGGEGSDEALGLLERAARESPLRARFWQQLGILHRLRGEIDEASRRAARAAALAAAGRRRQSAVGRSLSAAVYRFAGQPQGLVHEVWAERRPANGRGGYLTEILGSLTPELEQVVRNVFFSVREYARAKLPSQTEGLLDHHYCFKVTKEDEPSGGHSAGLPVALAFLSVFLDRPLPQDLASSGALVADSHDVLVVRPVGDVEHKVRGAYNRNLATLLLPAGNRAALEASPMVPRAVSAELVRFVSNLDEAVSLAFGPEVWLA